MQPVFIATVETYDESCPYSPVAFIDMDEAEKKVVRAYAREAIALEARIPLFCDLKVYWDNIDWLDQNHVEESPLRALAYLQTDRWATEEEEQLIWLEREKCNGLKPSGLFMDAEYGGGGNVDVEMECAYFNETGVRFDCFWRNTSMKFTTERLTYQELLGDDWEDQLKKETN